ncbi:MAG TPA: hypothetical protein VD788_16660, partial [Candidatus Polarisedimenticolaceae bacterium]|nr:hypothetical protein [Candidatus Polarisedimenticolaceae bacterium]
AMDIVTVKMITSFATRPSAWFALLSTPALLAGMLALVLAQGARISGVTEEWLVLATVGLLLLFLGVNLVSLGILGELCVSTGDVSPRRILAPLARSVEAGNETNAV